MSEALAQQYRRWLDYEADVHAKVVQSLETVPAEHRSSPAFIKAVALLAHLVAARRMWLGRFGAAPPTTGSLFPEGLGLAEVVDRLRTVQEMWTAFLSRATDEDLRRVFEYQSLDAGRFRNQVEDILAQLFGHSWYHRGQIAMLVRAAGGEPAVTDFIYWCREPLAP
jgi:uncharacterized damage-inducible protein DinB